MDGQDNTAVSKYLNSSTEEEEVQMSMGHRIAFVVMWSVGLLLNTACAPIVGCIVRKRPTWPTILLFVLILTDGVVVVLGLSISVATVINSSVLYEMRNLCYYQSIIINTWYLFSYIVVLAISMDRYLAVCHPFAYNKQLSSKTFVVKGLVALLVACVAMLLVSCLPLMIGADIAPVDPGLFCFFDWTSQSTQNRLVTIINVGITALTVGVMLFFTVATCFGIYKMVQSARTRDGNVSLTQKATKPDNEMEIKFAKLMIVVIIVFAACNLPFVIVIVVQMSSEYHGSDVGYIALGGLLIGTQLNPIVHAMVQRSVRRSFQNAVRALCCGSCG